MRVVRGAGRTEVWAHRGARRLAPENTLAAFTRALAVGADGVELDVRRTADDVVVVHHDPAARGLGLLAERTFAQVRATCPDLPTLDEALAACAGAVVNVELKCLPGEPDYDPADPIVALVAARLRDRPPAASVVLSSFNLDALGQARRLAPALPTGLLTLAGFDPDRALDLVVDGGHAALHPNRRGLGGRRIAALTDRAHERGVRVHVWTVNGAATTRQFAAAGVDAVITDTPDVAARALAR